LGFPASVRVPLHGPVDADRFGLCRDSELQAPHRRGRPERLEGQMRQEMQVSGLLPRDAIHLSVMKRCGLTAIASDDEGFEHCQGITLFQP
jgi:predicted nucleic acid-binding protein